MNERELSEAHLAAIVQSSDDAIISKDLNGIILSFNAAAERMFGYTAPEIIGRSVTVLIPPDRQHEEAEILSRIRRGERIEHYETVRLARDGRLIDISLTVSPLCDASGVIIGASKTARNITERKRATAALAAQREWFRVTLNSIGDAVIACDPDGRVTFINHEAEKLTGWTHQAAEGEPLGNVFQVVDEESHRRVENPADRVLRLGQIAALGNHRLLVARNGTEWPIADSAAPIIDGIGRVIGVVIIFREVTELKRSQERARALALERERLLHNERSARNEAESANRIKDDFVAMVSHELRTPLNAILGWTELLQRKGVDAGTRDQGLEVIARNTRLQAQLISDLLDVSRIVSGKLRLELESVDLAQVAEDAVEALRQAVAEKNIELRSNLLPRPVPIVGDPARLQQVLWNLLSNAIKFTPKGGLVSIMLRTVGDRLEIAVTDSGVGIRAELLSSVFDRFRQGAGMTTRRHGGLGLGLSIAKHLVELHGGSIRAWSAGEGKGATFTVDLPLRSGAASDQGEPARQGDGGGIPIDTISLRNLRVLVVEDDHDTRDLVRRLLEAHGAEVVVAMTAPEALEMLTSFRPDILVSDIGLPDVDGYELIGRVRRMEGPIANIPAVALTAFARFDDRTRALRAGFNAHVAKPVEPTELVITVGSFGNLIATSEKRDQPLQH
jgi:PAS domain S-box-containing protein